MKKLYSTFLMLFVTLATFAQSLTVDDVKVTAGSTATVTVNITGATKYIAAGMSVNLPSGFTFVYDDDEEAYTISGDVFAKTHSISDNLQQENVLKFAIASMKNATFKKDSGSLFSFTIACGDKVKSGSYTGWLKTIEFSDTDNQLVRIDNVSFAITVEGNGTDPTPSDTIHVDPTPVNPTPSDTTRVDPQPGVKYASVTGVTLAAGGQATGAIELTDAADFIAAGMLVNLPSGFTFVYNDDEEGYCVPGTILSKSHSVADELQAANKLKFAITSMKNAKFKSASGSLVSYVITCGANVAPGTYTGSISSIEFSKEGSVLCKQGDVSFTITVTANTDPTPTTHPEAISVSATSMTFMAGAEATGTISVANASDCKAAGMAISLPEGFSFVYNDDEEGFCVPGTALSKSHGITDNLQRANYLKVAVASMSNTVFKESGSLLSYTITCDATLAAGTYTGTVKSIEFSGVDNELVTKGDMKFTITVTANTNPDPEPVPQPVNKTSIGNMTIISGGEATAAINVQGVSEYIAAGMFISLPNGFRFVYNADEEGYCLAGDVFSKTHSIADNLQSDNLLKFAITSMKNAQFKSDEGTLVSFTIACDPELAAGTYSGCLGFIEYSDVNNMLYKENDVAFTITVTKNAGEKEYTPATLIANSYTRAYGDENPTFGFNGFGGDLDGAPEITCSATATSSVGTYPIRIKQGSVKNNKVTFVEGTLTIVPAPLYVSAGEYMMYAGNRLPKMSAQYFGFKNNDDESALTVQPMLTSEVTADSKPGTYTVVASGAASQNYDINYIDGTINVYSVGDLDGDGKFSVDDVIQFIDMYLLNNTLTK